MTFPFGFRFWHAIAKRYVSNDEHAILGSGEMLYFRMDEEISEDWNQVRLDDTPVKPEPWTGFTAKDDQHVYLNDIVRFTYDVGDMAWDTMDERERVAQRIMVGKIFVGQVVWRVGGFGVDCPLAPHQYAPTMQFSVLYAGGSEVLGNTNENPDWLEWLPDYSWMKGRSC